MGHISPAMLPPSTTGKAARMNSVILIGNLTTDVELREVGADYLAKGRKIALEGRLRYSTWEDEGKKRSAVEVVAYRVEFLPGPAGSGAEVMPFEAAAAAA